MRFILTIFLIISFAIEVNAQSCNDLPVNFKSYTEALSKVKSASFLIKESADCSKSSWIHSGSFYSCDGKTGYFIMKTKEGREYIHKNMPIEIWRQFKNANSFGRYYNYNISGKYQLYLLE
jgi:hypothetical protein